MHRLPDEPRKKPKKAFFSEEKKQKTLIPGARGGLRFEKQKFFGSFFQKRTFLPFLVGIDHMRRDGRT